MKKKQKNKTAVVAHWSIVSQARCPDRKRFDAECEMAFQVVLREPKTGLRAFRFFTN